MCKVDYEQSFESTSTYGHFGFSIQKRIYDSVGNHYIFLGDLVGWRVDRTFYKTLECYLNPSIFFGLGKNYKRRNYTSRDNLPPRIWIPHGNMTFSLDAPTGHLPAGFWSRWKMGSRDKRSWVETLFSRVDACNCGNCNGKEGQEFYALDREILEILLDKKKDAREILNAINERRTLSIVIDSLYPALNRLAQKKLVRRPWGNDTKTSEGLRRRYYQITDLGVIALRDFKRLSYT